MGNFFCLKSRFTYKFYENWKLSHNAEEEHIYDWYVFWYRDMFNVCQWCCVEHLSMIPIHWRTDVKQFLSHQKLRTFSSVQTNDCLFKPAPSNPGLSQNYWAASELQDEIFNCLQKYPLKIRFLCEVSVVKYFIN